MDPQTVRFACPNSDCPARGQLGKDNIRRHSRTERRYRCRVCGRTFVARQGTTFYRLRTADATVTRVVTLLAYGCPVAAIVQAFGYDERTVRAWQQRAGQHCHQVHDHLVASRALDLQQVQADEIKVKTQAGTFWMALALMVSTRLWLGGVVSPQRDLDLIQALADKVRAMAVCRPLLLAVDGLSSYVTAFRAAFRSKFPRERGATGRCKLVAWPEIAIGQVIKQRAAGRLTIERRIGQGGQALVDRLISATQGRGVVNTAFIERLNATFRQRLSSLVRRTRTLARRSDTLVAGMYLVGCFYNFCDFHHSLRLKLSVGKFGHHWVQRTPALAAGLTDHRWTAAELLTFKVPPPQPAPGSARGWQPPKKRGRPASNSLHLERQSAT